MNTACEDQLVAVPENYRVTLEKERVRVLEDYGKPHHPSKMHLYPTTNVGDKDCRDVILELK